MFFITIGNATLVVILNILENPIYKGDFIHGRRTKHPTYYFDVVEPSVSKEYWEECKVQQKKKRRYT